jgi:23S rRNA (adenine-N6)-dimethyltransferase
VSERQRRTGRDARRRSFGQNFLADPALVTRFVDSLCLRPGELVVEVGAGTGALTCPLVAAGVRLWAIEPDPVWARQLRERLRTVGAGERVRVIETDVRRLALPNEPYRIVANPPFGITTELLALLLDRPRRGPVRADLVLQAEVARRHASKPPVALRTAGWAPWWEFELGEAIGRDSFRPRPSVDAAVLTIRKRRPAILPERLAPTFVDRLRADWDKADRDKAARGQAARDQAARDQASGRGRTP